MSKQTLLAMGFAAVLLSACGGGGGGGSTPVIEAVPAAASTDPGAATSYVAELAAGPASTTDTLEPLVVPATLATSDTDEPAAVP